MDEHDVRTEPDRPQPAGQTEQEAGKVEAARSAAADVSDTARQAVGDVKHEAGRQARAVGTEVSDQARQARRHHQGRAQGPGRGPYGAARRRLAVAV